MKITLTMTPQAFQTWLSAMNISDAEAARRLGVSKNTITGYKRRGTTTPVALACSALYHRLEPWA